MLVGHQSAFSTENKLHGQYLAYSKDEIGEQWRAVLRRLGDRNLHENLSDVLDEPRLKALARRRDALAGT